jgi:hypothetical protein
MAGLLSAAPKPETGGGEGNQASPEEQAQYEEFVNNAYKIIYSPNTFQAFMARLKEASAQDPVEGLAATTVKVVLRVEESARRNGKDIADDVVFHAGVEILESLADTSAKAGIHQFDEKQLEAAALRAMDMYRAAAMEMGLISKEEAKAAFAELQAADKAGQLDKILPKEAIEKYGAIGQQAMQSGGEGEAPPAEEGAEGEQAPPAEEDNEPRGMLRKRPMGRG